MLHMHDRVVLERSNTFTHFEENISQIRKDDFSPVTFEPSLHIFPRTTVLFQKGQSAVFTFAFSNSSHHTLSEIGFAKSGRVQHVSNYSRPSHHHLQHPPPPHHHHHHRHDYHHHLHHNAVHPGKVSAQYVEGRSV